jgi:ABC-2 type transport system permease protein
MRVILHIARTELRLLFYSPVAWFLMIVFMMQCASVYFENVSGIVNAQEIQEGSQPVLSFITEYLFTQPAGLFPRIMGNLYLYLPLLTMGLISRELSSGTIKLLYTSPIGIAQIVLGKYFSVLIYSAVLIGTLVIFIVLGVLHVEHAELPVLLSATLGFFLLLSAYAAIGLFMSALTSYQVVAAISTFVMIGVLSFIGTIWQETPFFREITYFLSINGRAEKMLSGLITTKDVVYFLVIVYLFLGITILKLKAGTESRPFWVKSLRYLAVVGSALLVGCLASIHTLVGYWDVTAHQRRTLTPRVQDIIRGLDGAPLKVTRYANAMDRFFFLGTPALYKSNQARWEMYHRFKPNIELESVMYYDSMQDMQMRIPGEKQPKKLKDLARKLVKSFDLDVDKDLLSPLEIRKQIDLTAEQNRFVMKLDWKGRSTFLRVYDDPTMWPGETEVAAALLRLQQANLPKIVFVTGSLERDIDKHGDEAYEVLTNLPSFRNSLVNQGFDVVTVNLSRQNVPEGITAMVIADPRVALQAEVLEKVKGYMDAGGNLFIAAEPLQAGEPGLLQPILEPLGVTVVPGQIIQASPHYAPDYVEAYMTEETKALYQPVAKLVTDSIKLTMTGVATLQYRTDVGYDVKTFVQTDGRTSWNIGRPLDLRIKKRASLNAAQGIDSVGVVSYSPERGDILKTLPAVIGLTRKVNGREQHIVISGDADFLSNAELRRYQTANFGFSTSLFSWLSRGNFPVDTTRPGSDDNRVLLSSEQVKVMRLTFQWIVPGLLLAFGAVLLIRRKRK